MCVYQRKRERERDSKCVFSRGSRSSSSRSSRSSEISVFFESPQHEEAASDDTNKQYQTGFNDNDNDDDVFVKIRVNERDNSEG